MSASKNYICIFQFDEFIFSIGKVGPTGILASCRLTRSHLTQCKDKNRVFSRAATFERSTNEHYTIERQKIDEGNLAHG